MVEGAVEVIEERRECAERLAEREMEVVEKWA